MSITKPGRVEIAFVLTSSRLTRRTRYQKFIEDIGLKGSENVLDFGAGWGDNTYYIAKSLSGNGRVTALDVSEEWQKVAKKRLKEFHNIDFVNSDIKSSPLPNGSFDVIVVSYVLHDIPAKERAEVVKTLASKLKPNGFIHLREPTKERHGMPVDEIRSLMKKGGLKESSPIKCKKEFEARFTRN
jgi:ubiquinone/menaquinone biosynthesis C-methylase UbiE